MKVVAYDPFLTPERAVELGVEKVELDELLARADFITLHTPLTDQTRNILSRENARQDQEGRAHRQLRARRADRRGGAQGRARQRPCRRRRARRVRDRAGQGHRRCSARPTSSATPHLGASTNEAQVNVAIQVAEQMADFLLLGGVTNALNMPSLSAEEAPQAEALHGAGREARQPGRPARRTADRSTISIEVEGAAAELNIKPITGAVLAGLMRHLFGHGEHGQRAVPGQGARARRARDPPRPRGRLPHAAARHRRRPSQGERSVAGTLFGNTRAAPGRDLRHRGRGRARRAHALHRQRGRAGLHRRARHAAGRGRDQHRAPSTSAAARPAARRCCWCRSTSRSRRSWQRSCSSIPGVREVVPLRFCLDGDLKLGEAHGHDLADVRLSPVRLASRRR